LVALLRSEQGIEDEESILKYIAPKLSLDTLKITPSFARKLEIPKIIPVPKGQKIFEAKLLISGLQSLIKYSANLEHYVEFLKKYQNNNHSFAKR
jgi:hypothetical protein